MDDQTRPRTRKRPEKDYEIGHGRPPEKNQFKKGESGNPLGRRKGSRNLKTELTALMEGKTPLIIDGKKQLVSRRLALLLRLMVDGCRGNVKAASKLLDLDFKYSAEAGSETSESAQDKAIQDVRIIERFLAQHGVSPPKKSKVSK
jgi:hypothetical protein